jgi:ABC-type lipoprotein release transport system permease subunit
MITLLKMAWRDLMRNRRRSFFSALALGMGLTLLLLMAGVLEGEMGGSMDRSIRLVSGNLQVRAQSYDDSKSSLAWKDLIENPEKIVAQIAALPQVQAVTSRLFISGIVTSGEQSVGVRIIGIDPTSAANDPYHEGMVSGEYLKADDREGVLVGRPLADKMGLKPGDSVSMLANTSNGDVVQQNFIVRGVYSTQTMAYDQSTVFMPLAKAQALAQADNHASIIFVLLKDRAQTDAVAKAIQTSSYQVVTYLKLNEILTQTEAFANVYLEMLYLIVLAITATVIMNTLIMSVFERTREIGILAALGMKSHNILFMFFAESSMLAVGGIIIGLVLGGIAVAYFTRFGIYIGGMGVSGITMGDTIYAHLTLNSAVNLSITAFIITLLAGFYPSWMASHMEPVEALRGAK